MDTEHHSESGGDTKHANVSRYGTLHIATGGETVYFSVSWGDTAHATMFKCSYWGGDTAQNSKTEDWGAGWLACSLSDYSANTDSILQAETCEFPS